MTPNEIAESDIACLVTDVTISLSHPLINAGLI